MTARANFPNNNKNACFRAPKLASTHIDFDAGHREEALPVAGAGPGVQRLCGVPEELPEHLGHMVQKHAGVQALGLPRKHLVQLVVEQAGGLQVLVQVEQGGLGDELLQLHPVLQEEPHELRLVGDEGGHHHGVQL